MVPVPNALYTNILLAYFIYLHQYICGFYIYTNILLMYNICKVEKETLYFTAPIIEKKEGTVMSEESKTSKAQQKAVNKYVKNNYDRINVTFPKGRKEKIRSYAESHGESVNAFIVRAVNDTMERDNA